jgi:hypothetical protein
MQLCRFLTVSVPWELQHILIRIELCTLAGWMNGWHILDAAFPTGLLDSQQVCIGKW